jgi:hypothetical protein
VNADVGGTEVDGQVLVPLTPGLASLVIPPAGFGSVGVWDSDVPTPGEAVASVRQNLPPLVSNGQFSPEIGNWIVWGPRSAVSHGSRGAHLAKIPMVTSFMRPACPLSPSTWPQRS